MATSKRKASRTKTSKAAAQPTRRVTVIQPLGKSWQQWTGSSQSMGVDPSFTSETFNNPMEQEAWIFACIRLFSDSVKSLPLKLYDGDGDDANEITSGPVFDLFQDVNDLQDPVSLIASDAQNMELTGESVWFFTDDQLNPVLTYGEGSSALIDLPAAIWPVRGDIVQTETVGASAFPKFWLAPTASGVQRKFPFAAVLNHRYEHPSSMFRGLGPVKAVLGQAAQNYLAQRYQSALLTNGGDMGGVLAVGSTLTDEQFDRLTQQLEDKRKPGRVGEVLVVEGEAKYEQTPVGPKVMSYGDLAKYNRSVIAGVFRTPEPLIGLLAENYAAFRGHLKAYYEMKVLTWAMARESRLNSNFFPRLRDRAFQRIRCRHDTSRVEVLKGDIKEQALAAQSLIQVGVPINLALSKVGLNIEEFEGSDLSFMPVGLTPMVLSDADPEAEGDEAATPTDAAAGATTAVADTALNGAQVQSLVEIVTLVGTGEMSPETAVAVILVAFPSVDEAEARRIVSNVEVKPPAPEPAAPPPPAPAPEPDKSLPSSAIVQPRVVKTDKYGDYDARREYIAKAAKSEAKLVAAMRAKVTKVLTQMRAAQLRALDDKAAEAGKAFEPAAMRQRGFSPSQLGSLAEALSDDAALRAWKRINRRLAVEHSDAELREIGWCAKAKVSRKEIDKLVVALADEWDAEMQKQVATVLEDALKAGLKNAANDLGADILPHTSDELVSFLKKKRIKLAEGVNSTVAKQTKKAIIDALADHEGPGSLAERIQGALEDVKDSVRRVYNTSNVRAQTIARTEIGQVQATARNAAFEEQVENGSLKKHRWVTSGRGPAEGGGGGTVRESHWELDGEVFDVGSTITTIHGTRLKYARDPNASGPNAAGDVINCQCVMVPVDEGDE